MYNRYVRNDMGRYERVPVQDAPPPDTGSAPPPPPPPEPEPESASGPSYDTRQQSSAPPPHQDSQDRGILSGLLRKLNLDNIDTGDLLLLVLLFLLFKEGADEELLIALGLLLIL